MHQAYRIDRVYDENYRTKTFVLDGDLEAAPGQFAMVWLPGVDEKPFSIAAARPLTLTIVAVGAFTHAVHELGPGDRLWIRGPLGQGFQLPRSPAQAQHLLLVGGGYGAVPLRFLAERARQAGYAVTACLGARTARDVLLVDAFRELGASVIVTTEDGSLGTRGLVTQVVEQLVKDRRPAGIYGCGPLAMLDALAALSRAHRLPYQLSMEAMMRCGLGLCGACELEGRGPEGWLTCRDGPVLLNDAF